MPRVVRWPFGWRVAIKYRTVRQLAGIGLTNCHGAWVGDQRTIYVCKSDHVAEQCETIAHELQHAATDYRHYVDQYVRLPLQMESAETAYELAEEED